MPILNSNLQGKFIGVRRLFDWSVGKYCVRLCRGVNERGGDWFDLFITPLSLPNHSAPPQLGIEAPGSAHQQGQQENADRKACTTTSEHAENDSNVCTITPVGDSHQTNVVTDANISLINHQDTPSTHEVSSSSFRQLSSAKPPSQSTNSDPRATRCEVGHRVYIGSLRFPRQRESTCNNQTAWHGLPRGNQVVIWTYCDSNNRWHVFFVQYFASTCGCCAYIAK